MKSDDRRILTVTFTDPAADARLMLLKVPPKHNYTIEGGWAAFQTAIAAATDNFVNLNLDDGGSDGTGTTNLSPVIGGTPGWAAETPIAIVPTAGSAKLDAGDYLVLVYDETGTVAPLNMTVSIEYLDGIGSKANA